MMARKRTNNARTPASVKARTSKRVRPNRPVDILVEALVPRVRLGARALGAGEGVVEHKDEEHHLHRKEVVQVPRLHEVDDGLVSFDALEAGDTVEGLFDFV